jgi:hypothetical protein
VRTFDGFDGGDMNIDAWIRPEVLTDRSIVYDVVVGSEVIPAVDLKGAERILACLKENALVEVG